jgi:predicted membrane-bound dolichyl-phosphate-mannose-protein mannosyltransferase
LFLLVLCVSLGLRLAFVGLPPLVTQCEPAHCSGWDLGYVFDEWYYVNAARNIIGRPMLFGYEGELVALTDRTPPVVVTRYDTVGTDEVYPNATRFIDPNTEHPPLAKLIVAFSALLLGENALAYRLPSVVSGTLLLLFAYLAVRRLASDEVAFYAAAFLAFETLTFTHSRIFMLDIFMVSFMVLGFWLFLRGQPVAAGVAIGLAALSKEMGVIGLPILLTFFLLERLSKHMFKTRESAKLAAKVLIGFALPLALLGGAVALWWNLSPAQQIENVFSLSGIKVDHYNLDGSYVDVGSSYPESGNICPPWLWILNRNEINYFDRTVSGLTVRYVGAMNPMLIYLMLPAVVYSVWHFSKTHDRADLFGLVWWGWTYVVMYPLAFAARAMYIFYMLPVMGAVSLMAASLLCHPSMNYYVRILYLALLVLGMMLLFPVRLFP